jgi:hypothetical protein
MRLHLGIVALIWLGGLIPVAAQQNNLAAQSAALKEIQETAAGICYTVEQKGDKSQAQLMGEVQAKVTGVVAKIADLGIKASGTTSSEEYRGVSQEALGAALLASAGCRERVFDKLIDKILPSKEGMVVPPKHICRNPSNGVERYTTELDVTGDSGWRRTARYEIGYCNELVSQLRGKTDQNGRLMYPNGDFVILTGTWKQQSRCPPLNCPEYQYTCTVHVRANPLYKAAASPAACIK